MPFSSFTSKANKDIMNDAMPQYQANTKNNLTYTSASSTKSLNTSLSNQNGGAYNYSTSTSLSAIKNADNVSPNVNTGTPTSTSESSGGKKVRIKWPMMSEPIMGLPSLIANGADDMATVFEESFPIMTVKAFTMKRSDKNGAVTKDAYEDIPTGQYKFALINEGGVQLNVANNFAPTTIEDSFSNLAENMFGGVIGDMQQIIQNNRSFGQTIGKGVQNLRSTVGDAMNGMNAKFQNAMLTNQSDPKLLNVAKEAGSIAGNVLNMFGNALFLGNRIDIPNVWKGSSGGLTANIKIDLRAHSVGGWEDGSDAEYEAKIVTPLKILLALSCPLRKTDSENDGGGVTYENPPYLEVSIDKIFESRCCAVKNMSVSTDYKDVGYYKNRPRHVVVTLQLQDMYDVFVWDNKATNNEEVPSDDAVPSSAMYINRLMNTQNNRPPQMMESALFQGNGTSNTNMQNAGIFGMINGQLGSTNNVLSDLTQNVVDVDFTGPESDWYPSGYGLNAASWNNQYSATKMYDDAFADQVYAMNSGNGYSIFDDNPINKGLSSVGDTMTTQSFGNFNSSNLVNNAKNTAQTISQIAVIPNQISTVYNGVRSEINNFVPKITNSINNAVRQFTNPISLLPTSIINNITDPIKKIDTIYNIRYL